jgi:hypothetical protein
MNQVELFQISVRPLENESVHNDKRQHGHVPAWRFLSCSDVVGCCCCSGHSGLCSSTAMAFQIVAPVNFRTAVAPSRPAAVRVALATTTTATGMTTLVVVDTTALDMKQQPNSDVAGSVKYSPFVTSQSKTATQQQRQRRQRAQPRQPNMTTMTTTGTTTTGTTGDYWTKLARLSRRGQVAECEALVQGYRVENADHYDDDENDCQYQSYHYLLDALAVAAAAATSAAAATTDRRPNVNVDRWGHQANQILALLQTRYPETLDAVVYNKVLKVWSACARPVVTMATTTAAEGSGRSTQNHSLTVAWSQSHELLERMVQDGLADVYSYTTHLSTLAAHATHAAAQQAQDMCQALYDQYYYQQSENNGTCQVVSTVTHHVQPTTRTWNMVLLAWVKCGEPERAQQILQHMQDLDMDSMRPNVVSYSAVLDGWAKQSLMFDKARQRTAFTTGSSSNNKTASSNSGSIDPLERMECLYNTMLERSSTAASTAAGGDLSVRPNFWTYVTLIHAYAKRGDMVYTLKAQDLVMTMHQQARQEGQRPDVQRPNTQLVSAVLEAWQKTGSSRGAQQAEVLLDWMIAASVQDKDPQLAPNEYSFSCKCVGAAKFHVRANWNNVCALATFSSLGLAQHLYSRSYISGDYCVGQKSESGQVGPCSTLAGSHD